MVKYVSVSISEKPVPCNKDIVYILLFDAILHVLYALSVEIRVGLLNLCYTVINFFHLKKE